MRLLRNRCEEPVFCITMKLKKFPLVKLRQGEFSVKKNLYIGLRRKVMQSRIPELDEVIQISQQAGVILREGFGKQHQIRHKGRADLVTEVDRHSEEFILGQIRPKYPEHTIVAEESGQIIGKDACCWYIDPLDGTSNYAHGLPFFCVSIAFADEQGLRLGVVYDPIQDECFSAERGKGAFLNGAPIHVSDVTELIDSLLATGFAYSVQEAITRNIQYFQQFCMKTLAVRRLGATALNLSYVGAGRLDGQWMLKSKPWDIAAGSLIVQEAGGVVTSLEGSLEYLQPSYSVAAANPILHRKLLEVLESGPQG